MACGSIFSPKLRKIGLLRKTDSGSYSSEHFGHWPRSIET